MASENISQEFRSKNIDETRNYVIEETNRNKLMSKKHRKICTTLNYIEHFLTLGSTITGCVSVSDMFFLSWYSSWNYDLCNRIKNLCNNCRN